MSYLLYIETSSKNCSVGISENGMLLFKKELSEASFSHAEKLHPFINEVFHSSNLSIESISAVVVGMGPGSYTGLRIGVAAAKGICYALGLPLISVGSLETLSKGVLTSSACYIIPMIDARRMEVYTAVFDEQGKALEAPWAEVLEIHSFASYLKQRKCFFVGDGSIKFQSLTSHANAHFESIPSEPSVKNMVAIATEKFINKEFENLAYFEPFYLKEFYTPPSK